MFNWITDLLLMAFHRYSFDKKSDLLKYLLNIFTYLYGFWRGVGVPHLWLVRAPSHLPDALVLAAAAVVITVTEIHDSQ
jgi:hypothetical protein